MLTVSLVLAIFMGALVSGWHCALMCGGIAAAIERPREGRPDSVIVLQSRVQLFYLQLLMHFGRLTTYVLLGALAAWLGASIWQQDIVPIQRPLFALLPSCCSLWASVYCGSKIKVRYWSESGWARVWLLIGQNI